MNRNEYCNVYEIGRVKGRNKIVINKSFVKGLKHLSLFSHIIVIFSKELIQKTIEINNVDEKTGIITFNEDNDLEDNVPVYDVKPYFPCEDRVKESFSPKVKGADNKKVFVNSKNEIAAIGNLKKINGEDFIYIGNDFENIYEELRGYSHIKIMWWFSRFDEAKYRRATECDPPYENAPRTGIFASRSPVRPNPIALTTAQILEFDKNLKRIKVSKLDSFNNTPLIKIFPYIDVNDKAEVCSVPGWLKHWPEWVEEFKKEHSSQLYIKESSLDIIKKYSHNNINKEKKDFYKNQCIDDKKTEGIVIKGARQNNLKNIDVTIPYNKITAVTGVSGSGKSSLIFDTLYSESQRRFMESIGNSANNACREKPDFDMINGLPPAISISQKSISRNPRSTVGTITEIYNYLRNIFSTIGIRHCPNCGSAIIPLSSHEIYEKLMELPTNTRILIKPYNNEDLSYKPVINENLVYEHVILREKNNEKNMLKNIEEALNIGNGAIHVLINDYEKILFQEKQMCYECRHLMFELTPSTFSYNNPDCMCQVCNGLGIHREIDCSLIVSKPNKSILDGASSLWGNLRKFKENPNANWSKGEVLALAEDMKVDLELPWCELPQEFREKIIWGTEDEITYVYKNQNGRSGEITRKVEGAYNYIKRLYENGSNESIKRIAYEFMKEDICNSCNGERLNREGRSVEILGVRYPVVAAMTIDELKKWIEELPDALQESELNKVEPLLKKLYIKIDLYIKMGLNYLALNRSVATLSGGELQRLKIVKQLNGEITNMLYVLDEPSTGLHPKDYDKLIMIIKELKDYGNTVVIVDHNKEIIKCADYIIDIGKGAGINGGNIVAQGTVIEVMDNESSETGKYLCNEKTIEIEKLKLSDKWIKIDGSRGNNLKNIDIRLPIGAITCITGVSGSGKSTLVSKVICPVLKNKLEGKDDISRFCDYISGENHVKQIIYVDQRPIGRTSRSNIATYVGLMDEIKKLFASTNAAKTRGYKDSKFSFNSKNGGCEKCNGDGSICNHISFMEDIWTTCPVCKGKKYKNEVLEIKYNGKNIYEVLEMTVEEALNFFIEQSKVYKILETLFEVGLGYIKLGQSATTLSGGEAQRIKLSKELCLNQLSDCIYIFDEPTSGLHFSDIQNLLVLFNKIRNNGNTILIIEHNLDVIKNADWIIDLGPEGGALGGNVIIQGTVTDLLGVDYSYTARALKQSKEKTLKCIWN
ncbi:excinuclease ABC subunit A [Clostridium sporogenes]|uniref:excinuclease ABC subunit UvrA n=1 Tax=Clostridium sporogenes TaxID=1509 RepID=UPI0013D17B75|nr:excinuclease ABC subunit UvrA [Clostridium sporogenes]MBA4510298.1 excinuclease ABC subunit UvrA [Clostridium sporogenes]MDU6336165.1 excinuclease ABC subunit UvrA [Clostridium sporogenes]NFQ87315.1 excinuclease ABC subunit A [Clostridium sporogenes]